MADKPISRDELNRRAAKGADIKIQPKPTEIAEFSELVESLKSMVANESERIRADIARNQTNLEILATLQSLIRKQGSAPAPQPVDLSPIYEVLEEIRNERMARDRGAYEFEIKRDGRGFAQSITATPTSGDATKH